MASVYERHRITLDEYHRMVEAGVFEPDARVQLIEGELIQVPHTAFAVADLLPRF